MNATDNMKPAPNATMPEMKVKPSRAPLAATMPPTTLPSAATTA
jgi:hypothetical protein